MDGSSQDDNQNNDIINKLNEIKSKALQELLSSNSNLEGISADKKFEIYMSAISSTQDASMADRALESAMAIEDQPKKAECLYDLVDEINYKIATLK